MGTFWNVVESTTYIFLTLYFRFVSRKWQPTAIYGALQGSVTVLGLLLFLPESPKWLYGKKRYKECYEVMKKMAKTNNKQFLLGA